MNKPLILVVEDDPSIRNLITTTLKTNDYRYVVAPSGSTSGDAAKTLSDDGRDVYCQFCICEW